MKIIKNDMDPLLLYYGKYLRRLHDEYYRILDSEGQADLRTVHSSMRTHVFSGTTWVFTNVDESYIDPSILQKWQLDARYMGMTISDKYEPGTTNLVLTRDVIIDNEVIQKAQKDNVSIVSITWLRMSLHWYMKLPFEWFLAKQFDKTTNSDELEQKQIDGEKTEASKEPEIEQVLKDTKADKAQESAEVKNKIIKQEEIKVWEYLLRDIFKKDLNQDYDEFKSSKEKIYQDYLSEIRKRRELKRTHVESNGASNDPSTVNSHSTTEPNSSSKPHREKLVHKRAKIMDDEDEEMIVTSKSELPITTD